MNIPWIPVVERTPEQRDIVIVGQCCLGRYRIFSGWLKDGVWYTFYAKHPNEIVAMQDPAGDSGFVASMGDLRAEDFWLPLPFYPPTENVVDGVYPA
jgi:hypothetical protein